MWIWMNINYTHAAEVFSKHLSFFLSAGKACLVRQSLCLSKHTCSGSNWMAWVIGLTCLTFLALYWLWPPAGCIWTARWSYHQYFIADRKFNFKNCVPCARSSKWFVSIIQNYKTKKSFKPTLVSCSKPLWNVGYAVDLYLNNTFLWNTPLIILTAITFARKHICNNILCIFWANRGHIFLLKLFWLSTKINENRHFFQYKSVFMSWEPSLIHFIFHIETQRILVG